MNELLELIAKMYIIFLICSFFAILYKKIKNIIKRKNNRGVPSPNTYYTEEQQIVKNEYDNSYEPKYLMTLNEKAQYRIIGKWAQERNLIVFTKVRLLDLITPRKGQNNYKALLWKIQAKHVDFVICDKEIRVKCIIEINDNSHLRTDRAERDEFVTEVLKACGYKILQTRNATYEQLDEICGYSEQQ